MNDYLIQPFLLGLSTGIFCFAYCVPFLGSYLASEERNLKKSFNIVLEFSFGRLLGYILFGAVFGYLGEKITNQTLNLILSLALVILSVLLIVYALGIIKKKGIFCSVKYLKLKEKSPLLMGFLMGVNICPPFLMSLAYVFKLHNVFAGMIYFLMFFCGTTLYFLPVAFIGLLSKMKEFRLVGLISAIVVGFAFLLYGIYDIFRGLGAMHGI